MNNKYLKLKTIFLPIIQLMQNRKKINSKLAPRKNVKKIIQNVLIMRENFYTYKTLQIMKIENKLIFWINISFKILNENI